VGNVQPSASDHPATWKFEYAIYHAETRAQWRTWLHNNHATARGVWLCSWRDVDRPRCPYPHAVEEAICFGWIDSTATNLDDDRGLQLFTPRRPKSSWTRLNRERAADMDIARDNGWWTIYDSVEDLIEPDELRDALDANEAARTNWDQFPPSARKQMLWWVISAAQDDTRARRTAEIVAEAAIGRRARG
jgi:uncharacterized protein YdeI (YjbR/CyaY-like superfamily)